MSTASDRSSGRFFERVEVERQALMLLNERAALTSTNRLHGISPAAVSAWEQEQNHVRLDEQVAKAIAELWSAMGRFADQSRAVFDARLVEDNELQEALDNLASALNRWEPRSRLR